MKSFKFIIALIISTFLSLSALAQISSQQFESLSTPWMEVLEGGGKNPMRSSYPWWSRPIQSEWLKFTPLGKPKPSSAECDVRAWQVEFLKPENFVDFKSQAHSVREYTEKCRNEFETGITWPFWNVVDSLFLKFEPRQYSYGRHVMFHFENGVKLKGYLALKDLSKKRPFIIFRAGIFSNTEEFMAERPFFFQMFEQGPFNILILESLSGTDFTSNNEQFSLGGFDEGIQNYLIAKKLFEPSEPLSKVVSSVHAMGLSMGGHGTMYANILEELNRSKNQTVISSSLLLCPLLNFRDTLDFHMGQGFSLTAMNYWAYSRLAAVKKRYPELKQDMFVPELLRLIENRYQESFAQAEIGLKIPFDEKKALSKEGLRLFWELNNYWDNYHDIKTPVLIFATMKDPVVPWAVNSGRILDGRMPLSKSDVEVVTLQQGYHCSTPAAYDWDKMTTLLQSYVLKHSPEFQRETKRYLYPLKEDYLEAVKDGYKFIDADFDIEKESSLLQVTLHLQKSEDPSWFSKLFRKTIHLTLPLSDLDYQVTGNFEKHSDIASFKRWAYHNIQSQIDGSAIVLSWKIAQ